MRARTLLLLAAVPLAAAVTLKAGSWRLHADRYRIEVTAQPRTGCPHCHGIGGRWTAGAFPEMEACGCWSTRRELRIRLLPVPAWPDEPPF
ncbi:hypothetical protein AB0F11_13665 [Streptomyces sp. NPDC032472]|uniref:hypothetical protein n=1 Tax=Streptomyces sp. NPDC032472 TaxID=3155018 RepID=UPI0033C6D54D